MSDFTIDIQGDKALIASLNELEDRVQRRLIERAGRAVLKPVLATAKKGVPRNTGTLRKSLGVKKAKRTPKGLVLLSVGPRGGHEYTDEKGKRHNPLYYAIPVEYGHGSYPPAGFLRAAYDQHKTGIYENFAAELRARIEGFSK